MASQREQNPREEGNWIHTLCKHEPKKWRLEQKTAQNLSEDYLEEMNRGQVWLPLVLPVSGLRAVSLSCCLQGPDGVQGVWWGRGGLQAHQTGLLDFDTFSLFWRPRFETVAHWSQVWNLVVDPWRMFRWGFTDFTQLHKVIVTRAKTFIRTSLQSDCSPSGISRLSSLLRRFHVWFCYKCCFWKRLSSLRDYLFSCTQKK